MTNEEKNYYFYQLYNNWLIHIHEGKSVADFLERYGYHTIAIYGMGEIANRLCEELRDSTIKILYGVDRDVSITNSPLEDVYSASEELPDADAMIVTPFYAYGDIKRDMQKKGNFEILSIEEVIYSL